MLGQNWKEEGVVLRTQKGCVVHGCGDGLYERVKKKKKRRGCLMKPKRARIREKIRCLWLRCF